MRLDYIEEDEILRQRYCKPSDSALSEYTYVGTIPHSRPSRSKVVLRHSCGRSVKLERNELKQEKNYSRRCKCQSHTAGTVDGSFTDVCLNKGISGWVSNIKGTTLGHQSDTYTFTHYCGYTCTKTLKSFWRNHRCYKCEPTHKASNYTSYEHYCKVNGDKFPEWDIEFSHVGNSKVTHTCGYTKQVNLGRFTGLCPICDSMSAGEKIIKQLLDGNNIEHIQEYRIPNTLYRLDFLLPKNKLVIEYDGAQHYRTVEFFNSNNNDEWKSKWCETNGYDILRIPYKCDTHDKVLQVLQTKLPNISMKVAYMSTGQEVLDAQILSDTAFKRAYGYTKATSKLKESVIHILQAKDTLIACHERHISPKRLNKLLDTFGFEKPSILSDLNKAMRYYVNLVRYNLYSIYQGELLEECVTYYHTHTYKDTIAKYPNARGLLKYMYLNHYGHYKSHKRKEK